jgi:aminoglycoside 6'-N-acetyltransferase
MEKLRRHDIMLRNEQIALRPMAEEDWDLLLKWNNDPEVLYYAEGDEVSGRSLVEVQDLYRQVSETAFCFLIETDGAPVGECWLQRMNLERILSRHPGLDLRRIDLMIGEKAFWGRGIGTRAIRLLAEFGFDREGADAIFACDVADYNPRSLRAFEKAGFEICETLPQREGAKARCGYDLVLTRNRYNQMEKGKERGEDER